MAPPSFSVDTQSFPHWSHSDGVYKASFASTQEAYEAGVIPLFQSLDRLEQMLAGKDFLVGDQLTEADIRLFVTIVRASPTSNPGMVVRRL